MSDTEKATQNTKDLQIQLDKQAVSLGLVEKAQVRFNKSLFNAPLIKQFLQVTTWAKGITQTGKSLQQLTGNQEEGNKQAQSNITVLQGLTAIMTQLGGATKVASLGTTALSRAFFGLASSILFIFGIFLVIIIAVTAFAAVMADANSPLVQMITDVPILGEMFNGLRIILVGEDGESGLKGAFDIMVLAVVAGAAAFLIFGGPVAVVVATLIMAVGIFKWVELKTGSFVAALVASMGVLFAGAMVYAKLFLSVAMSTAAGVIGGVLLLVGGIVMMWKSLTGQISYWWGVIGSILTVIGVALLLFVGGVITTAALPIVAIAAVCAAIIFTIVYYWDEIKAFFAAAWNWIAEKATSAWNAAVAAGVAAKEWFKDLLIGVVNIVLWLPRKLWDGLLIVLGLWAKFRTKLGEIKDGVMAWFANVASSIGGWWNKGVAYLKALPGRIKTMAGNVMKNFFSGFFKKYNELRRFTIKDWMVKIPGVPDSWAGKQIPPKIPGYAEGGIITKPTLGMVGEAGSEAIIPLKGGSVPVTMTHRGRDKDMIMAIQRLGEVLEKSGNTYNIEINPSGLVVESERAREQFAKDMSKEIMRMIERDAVGAMKAPLKTIGGWF